MPEVYDDSEVNEDRSLFIKSNVSHVMIHELPHPFFYDFLSCPLISVYLRHLSTSSIVVELLKQLAIVVTVLKISAACLDKV